MMYHIMHIRNQPVLHKWISPIFTDMPSNRCNVIAARTRFRDRTKHEKLKADLLNIYGKQNTLP